MSKPELNGVSGQSVRYDGEKGRWIVDADEVKGLSITARRGGECSYYITTLRRSINLKELIRAQGMDPNRIKQVTNDSTDQDQRCRVNKSVPWTTHSEREQQYLEMDQVW